MKKPSLVTLICLLCMASFNAQAGRGERGHEPPTPEERTERMVEQLSLDEQQANSLLEIFTVADEQRNAMKAEHEQLIRQDMCALFLNTNAQVEAVLTAEQYAELDEMMQRRANHRAEHASWKGESGPGKRPSLEDCENLSSQASS